MIQKTIIGLQGTANIGKSMTLIRFGHQLLNTPGVYTADNLYDKDYRAVFNFKNITIGLQTYGDSAHLVNQGLTYFQENKCDIILITSKGFGATTDLITEYASTKNFRLIWTRPYTCWDNSISENEIKNYAAKHLLLLVNDIINDNL
jgi:hypothetical protein